MIIKKKSISYLLFLYFFKKFYKNNKNIIIKLSYFNIFYAECITGVFVRSRTDPKAPRGDRGSLTAGSKGTY